MSRSFRLKDLKQPKNLLLSGAVVAVVLTMIVVSANYAGFLKLSLSDSDCYRRPVVMARTAYAQGYNEDCCDDYEGSAGLIPPAYAQDFGDDDGCCETTQPIALAYTAYAQGENNVGCSMLTMGFKLTDAARKEYIGIERQYYEERQWQHSTYHEYIEVLHTDRESYQWCFANLIIYPNSEDGADRYENDHRMGTCHEDVDEGPITLTALGPATLGLPAKARWDCTVYDPDTGEINDYFSNETIQDIKFVIEPGFHYNCEFTVEKIRT